MSYSNILWRMLPLDEWNIEYLSKSNLLSIVSHFSGFVDLSMKYIELQTSTINILQNSLVFASKLVHLDLSGMPITSIDFILEGTVPPLEILILDDCKAIDTSQYCSLITVIKQLTKLTILSLKGVNLSPSQAVAIASSQPELFMLGLRGVRLSPVDVTCILQSCTIRLQFLQMSSFSNNKSVLHALGAEYVSIFFS